MTKRTWGRVLLRMAIICVVISAVSLMYHYAVAANSSTIALTFLLLVLGAAALWGLPEAIFASMWSMVCLNYHFLPPLHSMAIDDPQGWVEWGAFLITSLVASDLSTRSKKRALEATRRQHEIERMYALSCKLMLDDTAAALAKRIPEYVAEVFGCAAVAFYDCTSGQIHRAGTQAGERDLREATGRAEPLRDAAGNVTTVPVNLGDTAIGSLGFSDAAISATIMQSIANLVAMAMDRARKQEVAGQAEASRRHQELKSMLLDALAHELQTPLTSIRTGIAAMQAESPAPEQQEWLEILGEESARLSSMLAEAIQMARIEAGHVDLDKQTHTVDDLVYSALQRALAEPSQIEVDLPDGLPPVSADAGLIRLVIRQVVGNALKYSQPGTPVRVHARAEENCVVIGVTDRGPGIAPEEQHRIFERYYRGQQGRGHVTGMGMGLPIARQVIEAHEGRIWVESRPGEGTTFSFTLPFAHEEANV
jgi:two-component system sensor histidine kinase KdpD